VPSYGRRRGTEDAWPNLEFDGELRGGPIEVADEVRRSPGLLRAKKES